jgi:hypothetical protein
MSRKRRDETKAQLRSMGDLGKAWRDAREEESEEEFSLSPASPPPPPLRTPSTTFGTFVYTLVVFALAVGVLALAVALGR